MQSSKAMKRILTILTSVAILFGVNQHLRADVTMQLVADNDFALFVGNSTNATRLVYQNNDPWPSQISAAARFNVQVLSGENTFYLLGMGGGGEENISGTINGVDITTVGAVQSSDISSFLAGYNPPDVANGIYNANLSDIQTALSSGTVTWGSPSLNSSDAVIQQAAPNGVGYHFDDSTAVLFKFTTDSVGVPATVPEPSTYALIGLGGLALVAAYRCRRA